MTEEGFRKRFRSCRPEVGETFAQFAGRLARYLDRWMDLSNTEKTFHGLVDLLIGEQFIQSCGRELTLFLKERVPKNIEEMTTYADQYRESRGGSTTHLLYKPRKADPKPGPAQQSTQNPPHKRAQDSFQKSKKDKTCYLCCG